MLKKDSKIKVVLFKLIHQTVIKKWTLVDLSVAIDQHTLHFQGWSLSMPNVKCHHAKQWDVSRHPY
jgi:hypothetical protein